MEQLKKIRKYFWHVILRVVFYCLCLLAIYKIYDLQKRLPKPSLVLRASIPPPPRTGIEENYYSIQINGQDTQEVALFLQEKNGNLWIPSKSLANWKIKLPATASMAYDDEKYFNLKKIPGVTYHIDPLTMEMKLTIPAALFEGYQVNADGSKLLKFTPSAPGLFFNYNLLQTRNINTLPHNVFNGLFSIGLFNAYGVGTNSFIMQNTPDTRSPLRLLTTWRYDKPEDMWTLSLGDNVSASTAWTQSVNFGGVQWGRNFATQPAYITFPQPAAKGQATVPSSVNLYVNNFLVQQNQISPGPFSIANIPYVTGAGDLRIVTTDIQGRQQVVTLPFYTSNQLLKAGLTNYTYEFGMIRQNLGVTNFGYQRFLAAGTKSTGIRDDLTMQWHVEALSNQETAGISAFKQLWNLGVINGAAAASHINGGRKNGGLLLASFQRQTPRYTINASSQITTEYFTQAGLQAGQLSPRLINQLSGGISYGMNNFGVNYIRIINRNQPGNNMLTASFSRNIFFEISMSLSAMTNLGGTRNKGVFLTLNRALGTNTAVNLSNSQQNGIHQESLQIIRSLPVGPGYGYSLTGTTGTGTSLNSTQSSVSLQNDIGTYIAQMNQSPGLISYSLNVMGSIIGMGGRPYLTRNLNNNSFGVVQLPDMPNVKVYTNNQLTAITDKHGNALLPNLLPYQNTEVSINAKELPLNTLVGATTQLVAPYYSSGIIIPFSAKVIRSAILVLKQATGEPVPEGAVATVAGEKEEFLVGTEGETYLTGLDNENKVDVVWEEHHCQFSFTSPPANPNDPIPELGNMTCKEIADGTKQTSLLSSEPKTQATAVPLPH